MNKEAFGGQIGHRMGDQHADDIRADTRVSVPVEGFDGRGG